MSSSKRKIASNIIFLAGSQGITWTMTIVYTILVPRYLGPEGIGTIAIGLAVSSILTVLATLGNNTFILKEVARDPNSAYNLVGTAVIMNILLGASAWTVILLGSNVFNVSSELRQVLVIFAWTSLLNLAASPVSSALRGLEKMQYSFVEALIGKGLYTGLGVLFAVLQMSLVVVATATLIAAIPATLLNFYWFSRQSKTSFRAKSENIKTVVRGGMAFFVIDATFQVYLYMDALMLSFMTSETVVGYYNVPTSLFGTLLFIPVIVCNAILPALSRLAKQDPDNHLVMTRNTLSFFICVSLPMAAGTSVIANSLIHTLYDKQFEPSIPVLIILGWSVVPTYLGIGIVQSLISEDRQGLWSKVNLVAAGVNLLINLGLITLAQNLWNNGAIGAAMTLLVSEIIITSIGFKLLTKGIINKQFWIIASKSVLATGVMVLAIWPLRDSFFLLPIVAGGLVYAIMTVVLGIVPFSYLKLAMSLPRQLIKRTV